MLEAGTAPQASKQGNYEREGQCSPCRVNLQEAVEAAVEAAEPQMAMEIEHVPPLVSQSTRLQQARADVRPITSTTTGSGAAAAAAAASMKKAKLASAMIKASAVKSTPLPQSKKAAPTTRARAALPAQKKPGGGGRAPARRSLAKAGR